ncbi:MAG TPA: hypothetical protein DDY31_14610 [Lachnospiraceae bacterium]|nr:hypothetical protein [Lachnospiraceae bacterium]
MEDSGKDAFTDKKHGNYVGYEYKEILADNSMVSLLQDGYENFGWEVSESLPEKSMEGRPGGSQKTVIRLKRDRKIINKAELTRLQRNFEACVAEIQTLEKKKTSMATAYALLLAVIGTAFMAGSTFAVTAQPPHIILCIILAVPGVLGWIFPYFLYRKVQEKQTGKMTPLIEAKYDEIYEICEKGNKLL